jgi:ParB-like nuclease domain
VNELLQAFNEQFSKESGLKLAWVSIAELKEQDINARTLNPHKFDRLVKNLKNGGMESVPFCNMDDKGVYWLISGHNRKRAAQEAGKTNMLVLYRENMTEEQQRAKQIAHNAIDGDDNMGILEQMAVQITDIALRFESAADLIIGDGSVDEKIQNYMVDLSAITDEFRAITLVFTTGKLDQVNMAVGAIETAVDQNPDFMGSFLEPRENLREFQKACNAISKRLNINNNPMIFSAMARLANERLAQLLPPKPEDKVAKNP